MKTLLFALIIVCTTTVFGQAVGGGAVLSGQPMVFDVPSHPEHASQKSLANEQRVLIDGGLVIAQGERPLWEAMPETPVTPLGDTARLLRQEHAKAKKSAVVWVN